MHKDGVLSPRAGLHSEHCLILKRDAGAKKKTEGGEDRNGSTMLWNAVCVPAIFKTERQPENLQNEDIPPPKQTHAHTLSLLPPLHPYLLCLYYECYYYSCMSSCRLRFSLLPRSKKAGNYWHPARLPNQSPLRAGEDGGRWREGGKRRKRGGMGVGESVERKKGGVKTERHREEAGGADGEDSGGRNKRDV